MEVTNRSPVARKSVPTILTWTLLIHVRVSCAAASPVHGKADTGDGPWLRRHQEGYAVADLAPGARAAAWAEDRRIQVRGLPAIRRRLASICFRPSAQRLGFLK